MRDLIQKLETEERISEEEAYKLYDLDLFTLAKYAHKKRT
ncbi:aminofutalosine synthase MqnE, partial [Campylobacter helveticus]|nr:aminofutalosine synthase MqnE [Campylobacter helveticus]MCR2062369.1 aminofutalosine synthase MqnE [Campylobacter helveticus]